MCWAATKSKTTKTQIWPWRRCRWTFDKMRKYVATPQTGMLLRTCTATVQAQSCRSRICTGTQWLRLAIHSKSSWSQVIRSLAIHRESTWLFTVTLTRDTPRPQLTLHPLLAKLREIHLAPILQPNNQKFKQHEEAIKRTKKIVQIMKVSETRFCLNWWIRSVTQLKTAWQ